MLKRLGFSAALIGALVATGTFASAGGTAAGADCSEATASQLVEQHDLNAFLPPNPVPTGVQPVNEGGEAVS